MFSPCEACCLALFQPKTRWKWLVSDHIVSSPLCLDFSLTTATWEACSRSAHFQHLGYISHKISRLFDFCTVQIKTNPMFKEKAATLLIIIYTSGRNYNTGRSYLVLALQILNAKNKLMVTTPNIFSSEPWFQCILQAIVHNWWYVHKPRKYRENSGGCYIFCIWLSQSSRMHRKPILSKLKRPGAEGVVEPRHRRIDAVVVLCAYFLHFPFVKNGSPFLVGWVRVKGPTLPLCTLGFYITVTLLTSVELFWMYTTATEIRIWTKVTIFYLWLACLQ